MRYTKEDLSSVKKKINLTVPAEAVNAAIDQATRNMRNNVKVDGFRQGKAPLELIESRYHTDIYADAINKILNDNLEVVLSETGLEPISGVSFEEGNIIERDKEFIYSIAFEIMPVFDMPQVEGIAVTEYVTTATDEQVQETIDRIRRQIAEVKDPGGRLPQKGDIMTVNFSATDKDGNPVEDVTAEGFEVSIGENQVLPEFENLALTLKKGEKGTGKMTFPEDYHHKGLAGQTVDLSMEVVNHQELVLPEINDDFARMMANQDSVENLYSYVRTIIQRSLDTDAKAKTQQKMLEDILEKLDFDLPEFMVTRQLATMTREFQLNLLQAKGVDTEEKTKALDMVKERMRPQAETVIRSQIFLTQVAKQQGLSINEYELDSHLRRMATQNQQPYEKLKEEVEKNNMQATVSERLLTVKALDYIYDKAVVTKVEGTAPEEAEGGKKTKAAKPTKKDEAKAEKPKAAKKDAPEKEAAKEAKPKAAKKDAKKD